MLGLGDNVLGLGDNVPLGATASFERMRFLSGRIRMLHVGVITKFLH